MIMRQSALLAGGELMPCTKGKLRFAEDKGKSRQPLGSAVEVLG